MEIKRSLTALLFFGSIIMHVICVYGKEEEFLIENIRFEGLQHITSDTAFFSLPIKPGDIVNKKSISDSICALFSTGNFEDVRVFRNGKEIIIQLKERPIITDVTFSGNKSIEDNLFKQILDSSGIRTGEPLNRAVLSNFKKEIRNFYYDIGKYNVVIKTTETFFPCNRVSLKIILQEGISAKIRKINIIGNRAFEIDKILSKFQLRNKISLWNLFKDCKFYKRKFLDDLETLRNYYLNRGYIHFNIDSAQVNVTPNKKEIYITINITEGRQYRLSGIQISTDLSEFNSEIESFSKIKFGEMYNNAKIIKIENDIKNFLGHYGYLYPCVQTYYKIDEKNKTIMLQMNVNAGNRFYVREIHFKGNKFSKDSILRREMQQMEGTLIKSDLVEKGKDRLGRLGYFSKINFEVQRVPESPDQVDIIYNVDERNTGSFNFGIGYGTENRISFQANVQQDNWFGTGYSVNINGVKNDYQTYSEFSVTDPYFTVNGTSLSGNVFYNSFKANNTDLSSYTKKSHGFVGSLGFPMNEDNTLHLGLGYARNNLSNIQKQVSIWRYLNSIGLDISNNSKNNGFSTEDFIVNYGWTFTKLDRTLFPTKGKNVSLDNKLTIFKSDNNFYKFMLDAAFYFPIDKNHKWIALNRTHLGYGDGFGKKEMPFYENFYAGGSSTVRGFQSNNIGPKAVYCSSNNRDQCDSVLLENKVSSNEAIGGNAMIVTNLELIVPTPLISDRYTNFVRTSFFLDAGSVWDTNWNSNKYPNVMDYSDPSNVRMSAGVALQWASPLGPLVFSYAQPFKKYGEERIKQFQFSIGNVW